MQGCPDHAYCTYSLANQSDPSTDRLCLEIFNDKTVVLVLMHAYGRTRFRQFRGFGFHTACLAMLTVKEKYFKASSSMQLIIIWNQET